MSADVAWLLIASLLAALFVYELRRLHADPEVDFDLTDIFKHNGRVSRQAVLEVGAFMAMTFVLIHQELTNVLTDTYVAAYAAAWIFKGVAQVIKGTVLDEKEAKS